MTICPISFYTKNKDPGVPVLNHNVSLMSMSRAFNTKNLCSSQHVTQFHSHSLPDTRSAAVCIISSITEYFRSIPLSTSIQAFQSRRLLLYPVPPWFRVPGLAYCQPVPSIFNTDLDVRILLASRMDFLVRSALCSSSSTGSHLNHLHCLYIKALWYPPIPRHPAGHCLITTVPVCSAR